MACFKSETASSCHSDEKDGFDDHTQQHGYDKNNNLLGLYEANRHLMEESEF